MADMRTKAPLSADTAAWHRIGISILLVAVLAAVSLEGCISNPKAEPGTLLTVETQIPSTNTSSPLTGTENQGKKPAWEIISPTAIAKSQYTSGSIDQVLFRLKGLGVEEFFEESYKALILRSPQKVTALGLADEYGMRNDQLDDLSDAYQQGTWDLESGILDHLRSYDRESLTPEQQNNYDVYEWYLDMRVQGQQFAYHNYPLHHFLDSYQFQFEQLFTEYQPLEDKEDYEDYITRLSQVERQTDQLLEGLKIRERMGIIPPTFIVQLTREDIYNRLGSRTTDVGTLNVLGLRVYTVFLDKVTRDKSLNDEEKAALLNAAREQIEVSYIPAHKKLLEHLDQVEPKASNDAGVWKLPDGEAFYAWKLRWETSTNLTPEEVHELGLKEVKRIQEEIRAALDDLRYPAELISMNERIKMARDEAGYINTDTRLGKSQVIAHYEELLKDVEEKMRPVFDIYPSMEVIVFGDESFGGGGGFYVPGTLDGSRPGAFHTGVGGGYVPKMGMPSTLFHEAVPGHHFQISISYDLDLPTFRNDILINGYVEGWALYAEQVAWELGMYEENPHGNIGRLQLELLRAARLVADTGLHAKKWTRQEAKSYLERTLGGFTHEVDRYIVIPAQASGYKVGMLKILELRQLAQEELDENFDIVDFHRLVLGKGSMPLEMVERMVVEYINNIKAR